MEQAMLWVTVFGIIVIPCIGGIFNTLITNKINEIKNRIERLENQNESDKQSFYLQLNGLRSSIDMSYVRKDIYEQATDLNRINNDEKFRSLLSVLTAQYTNLELKINDSNINLNEKISGLKLLINEKFTNHKGGVNH